MKETLARLMDAGVVAVVRAGSAEEASRLVQAIRGGGIHAIEITMTVPGAVELLRQLAKQADDRLLLGAGTVLDPETARACMLAGAKFIVSPIFDAGTLACCRTYDVPAIAGALTPTEVVSAWRAGAALVKIFPASAVGGPGYIKAIKAALPQIPLLPTGGVTAATAEEYLRAGASAVGAGSDLTQSKSVSETARQYVQAVQRARG